MRGSGPRGSGVTSSLDDDDRFVEIPTHDVAKAEFRTDGGRGASAADGEWLLGGGGDDTFFVNSAGVFVVEADDAGVGGIEADDACTKRFEVVLSESRAGDEEGEEEAFHGHCFKRSEIVCFIIFSEFGAA